MTEDRPYFQVKAWSEFQHYHKRNPPWIRLHKRLLDNYEFHCLPVASRALAPLLWLLASEGEGGKIEAYIDRLTFRLRMTYADFCSAIKPLIDKDFIRCYPNASTALARRYNDATPETDNSETDNSDILTTFDTLNSFFPDLCAALKGVHPKTRKPNQADRDTLADLVKQDEYSQEDVMETLVWVIESEHPQAAFWRKQFGCISALRIRSRKTGLTKFTAMYEALQSHKAKQKAAQPECKWTDKDSANLELELGDGDD